MSFLETNRESNSGGGGKEIHPYKGETRKKLKSSKEEQGTHEPLIPKKRKTQNLTS